MSFVGQLKVELFESADQLKAMFNNCRVVGDFIIFHPEPLFRILFGFVFALSFPVYSLNSH